MCKSLRNKEGFSIERRKPHKNTLWVWRIRIGLCCLVFATLVAWAYPASNQLRGLFHLVWIVFFVLMFLIYYPIKYYRLSYGITDAAFVMTGGVLYDISYSMPLENLQFVTLVASPLQRMFGLCSLRLTGAGGRILLSGITWKEGQLLCSLLEEGQNAP